MFCSGKETIDHLFFSCSTAKYLRYIICCAFNIHTSPKTGENLPSWICSFPGKIRSYMAVGITAVMWAIWRARNTACFDGVIPQDPTVILFVILFQVGHYLSFWPGLQKAELRKTQVNGAKLLVLVATEIFHRRQGWGPIVLRIGD